MAFQQAWESGGPDKPHLEWEERRGSPRQWRVLTHGPVKRGVAGHVAQEGGPGPHHVGVAGLQQTSDLWQALFLEPDQLAHAAGHLRRGTSEDLPTCHGRRGQVTSNTETPELFLFHVETPAKTATYRLTPKATPFLTRPAPQGLPGAQPGARRGGSVPSLSATTCPSRASLHFPAESAHVKPHG